MKKWLALLLALAMCLSMTMTAFAQGDSAGAAEDGVTLDVDVSDGLAVVLRADTGVTDGVVSIIYDAGAVSISEEDVVPGSGITMWSVNADSQGEVKISWISETETTGVLFDLNFTGSEDSVYDDTFSASGSVCKEDGTAVAVYLATNASERPDTENQADTSVLQALYDACLELQEGDYTAESWADLTAALADAEAVLNDSAATQEEVDAALARLQAALAGLVTRSDEEEQAEPESSVDRSVLQAVYEAGLTLNEEDYTAESWSTFQEALEAAQAVLEDPNATEEDVAQALKNLQDAMAGLETVTGEESTATDAQTGDSTPVLAVSIAAAIALCGLLVLYTGKRRVGK